MHTGSSHPPKPSCAWQQTRLPNVFLPMVTLVMTHMSSQHISRHKMMVFTFMAMQEPLPVTPWRIPAPLAITKGPLTATPGSLSTGVLSPPQPKPSTQVRFVNVQHRLVVSHAVGCRTVHRCCLGAPTVVFVFSLCRCYVLSSHHVAVMTEQACKEALDARRLLAEQRLCGVLYPAGPACGHASHTWLLVSAYVCSLCLTCWHMSPG